MVSNIDQDEPSENCSIDDRNVIEQGITHEAKDTTVINTNNNNCNYQSHPANKTNCSYNELKTLRLANRKSLILGYINISSIRNNIEQLKPILSNSLDVITIAETKIDDTFPTS